MSLSRARRDRGSPPCPATRVGRRVERPLRARAGARSRSPARVERSRASRSSARQRSSPLRPVPRWSKPSTVKSRMSRGTSSSTSIISTTPAPPGPPERYIRYGVALAAERHARDAQRRRCPASRRCGRAGRAASRSARPSASGQPRQRSFASAGARARARAAAASTAVVIARRRHPRSDCSALSRARREAERLVDAAPPRPSARAVEHDGARARTRPARARRRTRRAAPARPAAAAPTVTCGRNGRASGVVHAGRRERRRHLGLQRAQRAARVVQRHGQHARAARRQQQRRRRAPAPAARAVVEPGQHRRDRRRRPPPAGARGTRASRGSVASRQRPPDRRVGRRVAERRERRDRRRPAGRARRTGAGSQPQQQPAQQVHRDRRRALAHHRAVARAAARCGPRRSPPRSRDAQADHADRLLRACRRRARRSPVIPIPSSAPKRAIAPSASAAATSGDTAPWRSISAAGTSANATLASLEYTTTPPSTYALEPGAVGQPPGHQPAGARLGDRDRPPGQQRRDLLVDRRAVLGEQRVAVARADAAGERVVVAGRRRARTRWRSRSRRAAGRS